MDSSVCFSSFYNVVESMVLTAFNLFYVLILFLYHSMTVFLSTTSVTPLGSGVSH